MTRGEGGPASLPLANGNAAWRGYAGRDVILGLRPEQISDPTNTEALGPDHRTRWMPWSRSPSPPARTRWR